MSKNLMFCSWKANDMKGSITPLIAKVQERKDKDLDDDVKTQ